MHTRICVKTIVIPFSFSFVVALGYLKNRNLLSVLAQRERVSLFLFLSCCFFSLKCFREYLLHCFYQCSFWFFFEMRGVVYASMILL